MQHLQALVIEDRMGTVYRGRSSRRPYLVVLAFLAILGAIVAIGLSGPRRDLGLGQNPSASGSPAGAESSAPSASPEPTLATSPATLTSTPAPVPPQQPLATDAPIDGIPNVRIGPADLRRGAFPTIGSFTPTASNVLGLFDGRFVIDAGASANAVWLVDPWAEVPSAETLFAGPRCGQILAAAAGSGQLIVAETSQVGADRDAVGPCPGTPQTDWRVAVVDLATRKTRTVASAESSSELDYWHGPKVAISSSFYAYTLPAGYGQSQTIEVRILANDALLFPGITTSLWTHRILMSDNRLVVLGVTNPDTYGYYGAPNAYRATLVDGWVSAPVDLGLMNDKASIAADGTLVYVPCTGESACWTLRRLGPTGAPTQLSPEGIGVTALKGDDEGGAIAWTALPYGGTSPKLFVRNERWPFGVALLDAPDPLWLGMDGDLLVWVGGEGLEYGTHVYAVDLSAIGLP